MSGRFLNGESIELNGVFFFQPAVFDCRRVLIHALIISSSAEIQECKVQLYQVSKPTAEHFHHCAVQAPGVDVWFFSCPLENGNIGDSLDGYFKYINYMYIYIHMYAHLISFNYIYTHTTVYIYIYIHIMLIISIFCHGNIQSKHLYVSNIYKISHG